MSKMPKGITINFHENLRKDVTTMEEKEIGKTNEVIDLLVNQIRLLASRSVDASNEELCDLSKTMWDIGFNIARLEDRIR
jgi:hypothetical protein